MSFCAILCLLHIQKQSVIQSIQSIKTINHVSKEDVKIVVLFRSWVYQSCESNFLEKFTNRIEYLTKRSHKKEHSRTNENEIKDENEASYFYVQGAR